jgi:hypothetical protein
MKPPQLELDLKTPVGWGGVRDGAGSKAGPRPRVWRRARVEFPESHPGLVTIRVRKEVPSLRTVSLVRELERSFRETLERKKFRVTHYSIQRDHLHLLVEAEDAAALSCGRTSPIACAPRPAVARAQTWLLRAGWRRHGLIRHDEVPGGRKSRTLGVRPT